MQTKSSTLRNSVLALVFAILGVLSACATSAPQEISASQHFLSAAGKEAPTQDAGDSEGSTSRESRALAVVGHLLV